MYNTPYEQRLITLGLPTLQYRRKRNDLVQVYKIVNKIDKLNINSFFNIRKESKTRGNSHKFIKSQNRLNIRANAFSQRVVNDWNSLPEECIASKDLNNFKSTLNKHWKKHPKQFEI